MKSLVLLAAVAAFIALAGCGQDTTSSRSTQDVGSAQRSDADQNATPLEIVNRRMSAYNRHDLTAFMELYAEGVEVFTYPDQSLGKGRKHLRSIFEPMFAEGVVQVAIQHQIAKDSYVVNHETVTAGGEISEYVSIYEVKDGLIRSVRFVRD